VIRKDYAGPTFVLQLRNGSAHRVLLYEWALVTDHATEMIDGWYMKRIIEVGSSHAWETEWEPIRAACVAAGKWIYPAVMVDASPMSDPTKHEPDEVPDLYLPLDPPTGFDWTAG
jgi:hypothetical protein